MKKFQIFFGVLIFTLLIVTGCATVPQESTNRATAELRGECLAMFSYPRFEGAQPAGLYAGRIGYQYWGESLKKKAFAIGTKQDGAQVCAYYWTGRLDQLTQERVNAGALDTCNKQAPGGASCVIYAIGDTIVYDKSAHEIKVSQDNLARAELNRIQRQQAAEEQERQRLLEQERARETKRRQEEQEAKEAARQVAEKDANAAAEKTYLDSVKKSCIDLGFKQSTESFGKCVLQLLERDKQKAQKGAPLEPSRIDAPITTRGDGTPNDLRCQQFGYSIGTPPYAECRIKLESLSRQAEARRQDYERRQQEYEAQVAEYERQRKITASLAMVQCGLNIASGANCSGGRTGPAPVAPQPVAPVIQNLTLPGGRVVNCTTIGLNTHCQ